MACFACHLPDRKIKTKKKSLRKFRGNEGAWVHAEVGSVQPSQSRRFSMSTDTTWVSSEGKGSRPARLPVYVWNSFGTTPFLDEFAPNTAKLVHFCSHAPSEDRSDSNCHGIDPSSWYRNSERRRATGSRVTRAWCKRTCTTRAPRNRHHGPVCVLGPRGDAKGRGIGICGRDIQTSGATERNWTTTQRNKPFPESRAAPDFNVKKEENDIIYRYTLFGSGRRRGQGGLGVGGQGPRWDSRARHRVPLRPPRGAGHAAAAAAALRRSPPAGPLPRRFLSLSQPLPPRVGDVKIPRKSRVVAPRAEARVRRPAAPSRGARGRARDPPGPSPVLPGGQGPADAASRTPPAPNRVGKFTFIKRRRPQSYFRPREACPAAASDRKRGKFGSFYFLLFLFSKGGA